MNIKERNFVYNIVTDCRLRHRHKRVGKNVINFMVQLEVRHPKHGTWEPVIRYDTAHGRPHQDRQHADGSVDKMPLPIEDYNQALNYAEIDLKNHWETYRNQFLEELEYEKRK